MNKIKLQKFSQENEKMNIWIRDLFMEYCSYYADCDDKEFCSWIFFPIIRNYKSSPFDE